jgi:hypothetical protein
VLFCTLKCLYILTTQYFIIKLYPNFSGVCAIDH